MRIVKDFIPASNRNRPQTWMNATHITVHETANRSPSADANLHSRYVKNPTTRVSWHFTVDDGDTIYQHLPLNEAGYHAGTSRGNRSSIGIEICVNSGGDFEQAVSNAQALIYKLQKEEKINHVVSHKFWSGKNCPTTLLNRWGSFLDGIGKENVMTEAIKQVSKGVDNMRNGDRGNEVKELQTKLNKLGFNVGAADGILGDNTEKGVKVFQKSKGLTVDGIAGPKTLSALDDKPMNKLVGSFEDNGRKYEVRRVQ